MTQLALFDLEITPTAAMLRDEQHVAQCKQCGTVVVAPRPASFVLMSCPVCGRIEWSKQELPLAGLRRREG